MGGDKKTFFFLLPARATGESQSPMYSSKKNYKKTVQGLQQSQLATQKKVSTKCAGHPKGEWQDREKIREISRFQTKNWKLITFLYFFKNEKQN